MFELSGEDSRKKDKLPSIKLILIREIAVFLKRKHVYGLMSSRKCLISCSPGFPGLESFGHNPAGFHCSRLGSVCHCGKSHWLVDPFNLSRMC